MKGQADLTSKMAGAIAALIILAVAILIATGFIEDIADNTIGISGTVKKLAKKMLGADDEG